MVEDMIRIFEAQRLVSLTTLFDLADNWKASAKGEKLNTALAAKTGRAHLRDPAAAQLVDRHGAELAGFGYWTDKHIEAQRKLNLRALIEKAAERSARS